ncbi:uncharacterized protein TRIADDRAFT_19080 [Trichoplax adhaerens]|uniref:Carboxylic ester hydrolase n=1 Tax=Trichoplax adhaerens TaxID=10228 RepID=B3RKC4_TRIAD|nr:hypothetical protein TRIADDRAFT_19080 [Trichoplax adhaerens]EDV29902.1 hypothetical protein TRIADDRAFT_19080 [Trichoplax adhaerens]|eukprot:XP_002109104.1 hypothetical protein TRIADDRAFT_19080 [Trichoplax adhaerens]
MAYVLRYLIIINAGLLSIAVLISANNDDSATINIANGPIQGKKEAILNNTIYSFLGIPYALPPIGSRRYQRAVPIKSKWKKTRQCFHYQSSCSQHRSPTSFYDRTNPNGPEYNFSEDCLYVNVFTPTLVASDNLPVIVWIHGGSMLHGNGAWWHGQTLASHENVIVVTINYRLGSFGLLATRNSANKVIIEPNLSLWDQNQALKWIQNNIAYFGGNAKNIVLSGHSAGSLSITYHMMSPESRDLFHSVALFSGTNMMKEAYHQGWEELDGEFDLFLSKTSCNNSRDAVEKSVECLKQLSHDELLIAQEEAMKSSRFPFRPVVGSEFILDNPRLLLDQGLINPMNNILISTVKDDGAVFSAELPGSEYGIPRQVLDKMIHYIYSDYPETIRSLITHEYTRNVEVNDFIQNRHLLDRMLTQGFFQAPAAELASKLGEHNYSSYMILFDQFTAGSAYYPHYAGVIHQMEVPYIFGYPLHQPDYIKDNYTEDDVEVSKHMMKMMSSLAKNG